MKLTKDNKVIDIDNENHVAAFVSAGWVKFTEPVATAAIEEPVAEPEVYSGEDSLDIGPSGIVYEDDDDEEPVVKPKKPARKNNKE